MPPSRRSSPGPGATRDSELGDRGSPTWAARFDTAADAAYHHGQSRRVRHDAHALNPPGARAPAEEEAMDFTRIPGVHPRVIEISRHGRTFAISVGAGCAPGASRSECTPGEPEVVTVEAESGAGFGAGFGVKRPLRFLAYKLGLSEPQVSELAAILDELKTERAQAAVDDRRTLTSFAEAVTGEAFDA